MSFLSFRVIFHWTMIMGERVIILLMEEILPAPVEVGSLSPLLTRFFCSARWCSGAGPSTVGWIRITKRRRYLTRKRNFRFREITFFFNNFWIRTRTCKRPKLNGLLLVVNHFDRLLFYVIIILSEGDPEDWCVFLTCRSASGKNTTCSQSWHVQVAWTFTGIVSQNKYVGVSKNRYPKMDGL